MVGQSDGGEMRECNYENESICHNQPTLLKIKMFAVTITTIWYKACL
jgi:hypothetical protein